MIRRFRRTVCWMLRHETDGPELGSFGAGYLRFSQYRCRRCGELYWQWGNSTYIQVHDDDPRLAGLR